MYIEFVSTGNPGQDPGSHPIPDQKGGKSNVQLRYQGTLLASRNTRQIKDKKKSQAPRCRHYARFVD